MKKVIVILTLMGLIFSQDTTRVVVYYSSGKVKSDGMKINNFKHGRWMHYDKNGSITIAEKFNYGKRIEFYDVGQANNK